MENRITGLSPQPITEDEVDLTENVPAADLCEEVKRLTAETREALLEQALAVSNEKCNGLILQLNARVTDLTRQVRSVKWMNEELASSLKDDAEKLTKEMKEENRIERGFRKFFFWLTPALLLLQSVMTAMLLLR